MIDNIPEQERAPRLHAARLPTSEIDEFLHALDACDAGVAPAAPLDEEAASLRAACGRARTLLEALPPPAGTRRARVERAVLSALSVLGRDVDAANRHLEAALADGEPQWLVRTIIEPGPDVHKLLVSYTPTTSQERYLEALLAAVSRTVAPMRVRTSSALVDPLSAREVTVLRYLSSRLTYQEIAAALFVSVNTLKSHVRTIYRKLGVASRVDAVDAGRRVGLI